jgi:hypothetical protein
VKEAGEESQEEDVNEGTEGRLGEARMKDRRKLSGRAGGPMEEGQ